MSNQFSFFKNIDRTTIYLYITLVLIGWATIYSAEFNEQYPSIFDLSQRYGKQFLWIVLALIMGLAIFAIDVKFFPAFSYIIFGGVIITLVGVLLFGVTVNASRSWFQVGGIAMQPSEFAKYATGLAMAKLLYNNRTRQVNLKTILKPLLLLVVPMGLIFLQNDTGTTLVFSAFVLVLYREGYIPLWMIILGLMAIFLFILTLLVSELYIIASIVIIFFVAAYFLKKKTAAIKQLLVIVILLNGYVYTVGYFYDEVLMPHQKLRIEVLLDETVDLRGAGYNLHQSKIAIGSGGFWGQGFLQGTQTKFNFVPEQATDFIFCTIGEEWGFVGSTALIVLYIIFLTRLVIMAERQRSVFSRVLGYSLASIIFFHFTINIGMTIGLIPVIGIPLPFISYGGSALWAFSIFLFTFLKMDSKRLDLI